MVCPNCKAMLAYNATSCNKCGMVFQMNYQGNQSYTNSQFNYNGTQQNNMQNQNVQKWGGHIMYRLKNQTMKRNQA